MASHPRSSPPRDQQPSRKKVKIEVYLNAYISIYTLNVIIIYIVCTCRMRRMKDVQVCPWLAADRLCQA